MLKVEELKLYFQDTEWEYEYTDHDRNIVRAVVYDDNMNFYFARLDRDDIFGKAIVIETSGGGVEKGEDLTSAIVRELQEELGVNVEIKCKIGVVEDYYNLIHRHNINNYYLCRVISFGKNNLTEDEINSFHLTTLKLPYEEAVEEYKRRANTKLGRILLQRELPILERAKEILEHNV
ncbi:MAG: NUDIX hydrolase [Clostridia bacterium]|nr:NUDIX hydrolase [Clostridia bacterium]